MSIWNRVIRQAKKEYSPRARIAAVVFEACIFLVIIPGLLVYLSTLENGKVSISGRPALVVIGGLIAMCGKSLAMWTVGVQFHSARGTPVPIMATKKLLTNKPYSLCRNPMALGTILFYTGISVIARSYLSAGTTMVIALYLIVMIKAFEEKEMALRFGEAYIRYKRETPFLIPRVPWLRRKDGK
jgi:protein-S-isoprenylcysteine O-methyltransferase Ste14